MNITLTSELKRFVAAQAGDGRYEDASEVVREALRQMQSRQGPAWRNGVLAGLDGDIEALIMQVMMQAAKDAEEDLREIMREMQARNAAKKALRDLIRRMNRDRIENELRQEYKDRLDFSKGMGSERAYHRAPLPVVDLDAPGGLRLAPADLCVGKLARVEQIEGIVAELKDKLDSLSELTEMTMLRLQMLMDRRSKLEQMISNVMKAASDTQASIIQNLK